MSSVEKRTSPANTSRQQHTPEQPRSRNENYYVTSELVDLFAILTTIYYERIEQGVQIDFNYSALNLGLASLPPEPSKQQHILRVIEEILSQPWIGNDYKVTNLVRHLTNRFTMLNNQLSKQEDIDLNTNAIKNILPRPKQNIPDSYYPVKTRILLEDILNIANYSMDSGADPEFVSMYRAVMISIYKFYAELPSTFIGLVEHIGIVNDSVTEQSRPLRKGLGPTEPEAVTMEELTKMTYFLDICLPTIILILRHSKDDALVAQLVDKLNNLNQLHRIYIPAENLDSSNGVITQEIPIHTRLARLQTHLASNAPMQAKLINVGRQLQYENRFLILDTALNTSMQLFNLEKSLSRDPKEVATIVCIISAMILSYIQAEESSQTESYLLQKHDYIIKKFLSTHPLVQAYIRVILGRERMSQFLNKVISNYDDEEVKNILACSASIITYNELMDEEPTAIDATLDLDQITDEFVSFSDDKRKFISITIGENNMGSFIRYALTDFIMSHTNLPLNTIPMESMAKMHELYMMLSLSEARKLENGSIPMEILKVIRQYRQLES